MKTNPRFPIVTRRGFSLIEVLIAVLVLSVGLLALGALQASLVRSSTESKARSVALAIAEQQLEGMRTFSSVDTPGYADIDDAEDTVAHDQLGDVTVGVAVERFGFDRVSGEFVAVDDNSDPLSDFNNPSAEESPQFVNGQEFKRVTVEASWVASDGDKSVVISDIISSVNPEGSARVMAKPVQSSGRPQVLYRDPSLEAGVIPIAIGDGSDTAATNPRPEVAAYKGGSRVIETRFDVLTYQGLGDDTALVQSRVETVVVGCQCETATTSDKAYRPAYWNGLRYTRPEMSATNAPAKVYVAKGSPPPQSPHCTACCRDHHDTGFSGAKFSPRRDAHSHSVVGGVYTEACRMIRVDGIISTATDLYNDHFSLLATESDFSDPAPSAAASESYEGFVLDYLGARAVTGSSYNTPPSSGEIDSWEATRGLNDPDKVNIPASGGSKWLHARGLYVDYLEPAAVSMIDKAKAQCDTEVLTDEACVLRHLPFTSINLTELARWIPPPGSATDSVEGFYVTAADFVNAATSGLPVRGNVKTTGAAVGSVVAAVGKIADSNGGVAVLIGAVNGESVREDSQDFRVVGEGGGGPGSGPGSRNFSIDVQGYPINSDSGVVAFSFGSTACQAPLPYSCTGAGVDGPYVLEVGLYNISYTEKSKVVCESTADASTKECQLERPVCTKFGVANASVDGIGVSEANVVVSDSGVLEKTSISFDALNDGSEVVIEFSSPVRVESQCQVAKKIANCNSLKAADIVWVPADPCA